VAVTRTARTAVRDRHAVSALGCDVQCLSVPLYFSVLCALCTPRSSAMPRGPSLLLTHSDDRLAISFLHPSHYPSLCVCVCVCVCLCVCVCV
jgi:hypothetical protein